LIKELRAAGNTEDILKEANIFALYQQYTELPKDIARLKTDREKVREALEKKMKAMKLNK
jgi:hypothetical protein